MSSHWPSQQAATRKATKSTAKAQAYRWDWASAALTTLFVVALVAGVAGGLFWFLTENVFPALEQVSDKLNTRK